MDKLVHEQLTELADSLDEITRHSLKLHEEAFPEGLCWQTALWASDVIACRELLKTLREILAKAGSD